MEDGFLWAGLVVLQKIVDRAVALAVPPLLISGVLRINVVAVMFQIVGVFDLLKTEIGRVAALSGQHGGHAPIAVPIDVLHDLLSGNVFTVLHIEAAVIVPWIMLEQLESIEALLPDHEDPFYHLLCLFCDEEEGRWKHEKLLLDETERIVQKYGERLSILTLKKLAEYGKKVGYTDLERTIERLLHI